MKNLALPLGRLAIVLAGALSLGACSRTNYAANTQAASKPLGTSVAIQPQVSTNQAAPYVPVAAEESAVVKSPSATSLAPATAAQPVAPAAPAAVATITAPVATPAMPTPAAKPTAKLNLAQRLALRKITKKLDKLTAQAPQFKQKDATAARGGLDSNLRSAILFGLVGLIVLLFSGVSSVFGVVGTILLIIGLVFLVLWLLDQA